MVGQRLLLVLVALSEELFKPDLELENQSVKLKSEIENCAIILCRFDRMDSLTIIRVMNKKEDKDWWKNISLNEKESIKKGLKDAKLGKLIPHSKVRLVYAKWLD